MHPEAPRSGHIQKKCTICNSCNVCNVCPIEFMYNPRTPPQYALHRGVSQPPVFSKKNAAFRRQTCGTSTNCLNLRSVSDTFENRFPNRIDHPTCGSFTNVLKIRSGSDNFQKIGFNLSIIQGHHHNNLSIIQGHHHNITPICYTQRGVTTQRPKQK